MKVTKLTLVGSSTDNSLFTKNEFMSHWDDSISEVNLFESAQSTNHTSISRSPHKIPSIICVATIIASLYFGTGADAIVTVGASGANGNNQSEASLLSVHSDFNYWDNIVNLGVGSGIYLGGNGSGAGYVLTANHLLNLTPGSSSISIAGSSYGVTNSSRIRTT